MPAKENPTITIFTPSYNRAYILSVLYESLKKQTNKDFEWLIVDDGSTDNTESIVQEWLNEASFPIHYVKQSNGGKHSAINRGVELAHGELFFIVDSDDYLTEDAVDWIINTYDGIKGDEQFAGLSGIRIHSDGNPICGEYDWGQIDTDAISIREVYKVHGDLAEVYRTEILKYYPFPIFEGERFCTEALVWYRIAQRYKVRYAYHGIYVCEYLEGGLSDTTIHQRRNSFKATTLFYFENFHYDIPYHKRLKAAINYWRFMPVKEWRKALGQMYSPLAISAIPLGLLMRIQDSTKLNK